jgi:serine/threonine protein kinase/Tfp pilus assembly protein PilF
MLGKTISHYRILEKLGEGGMGVVYKAEDTKLNRFVALKFLPPRVSDDEATKRFVNEAHAVSALDHPNICAIYEIDQTADGQMFIVMPCYEGASLEAMIRQGPLGIEKAAGIASQVARGLAKAHERGIVHRDVKPGNILVTGDGLAKIVDFGLAKLVTQTKLTRLGTTLGTVRYMSPEQARGEEVDGRSDIWSLGAVLYEMVTGKPSFQGEHEQAIIYSILNETPEAVERLLPGAPKALQRIVRKALAKDPGKRYQRASDMADDLDLLRESVHDETKASAAHAVGARRTRLWLVLAAVVLVGVLALVIGRRHFIKPGERPIKSVAVLPFQNLSADPGQEYFSDGMTEAIIKELSQIKALRVISRTSVMRYKNTDKMVPEIARELSVDAVVEGSVLKADHDVRITAQLIAAHPEKHLWADDFTRTLENVLLLQSEVAQAIAREIRVAVTPSEQERMARARVVNPEAHEAYLKGKYFWGKSMPSDWYKSMQYFQQAIDLDSTYALAYAGMAEAYDNLGSMGIRPPMEVWPKVKAYAEKALALDPALAEGILLMGDVKLCYDWDVKGGEEYYKRALELDPNLALAHFWYGFYLTSQGIFKDGLAEMKRSLSLDPLSPVIMSTLAFGYAVAGEYDSAFAYVQRAEEIDSSDASIYEQKTTIYLRQGKYAEAIDEAKKGVARGITPCLQSLAEAYALSGQTGEARKTLSKLLESIGDGYYSPLYLAVIYCALGDREKVLECFEKGYEERDVSLIMPALAPPWCDFIKSDPRYQDIMKKVSPSGGAAGN